MDLSFTIASFLVALGILITVHEFGHFWVARRLGVKVLRFSIGFGRPLLRFQRHPQGTEFVLALLPLGGYVKMLDEREEEVPPDQIHLAFNRQVLWKRAAIVAAGPVANFVFAVIAYWAIFVAGDTGLRPVVGAVEPASIAAEAGFREGDEILGVAGRDTPTWDSAVFAFLAEALGGDSIRVRVRDSVGLDQDRPIPGERLAELPEDPSAFSRLGLTPRRPELPAVIGELTPGGPAALSGFALGDRVLTADGQPIRHWPDWVTAVRERPGQTLRVEVEREGRILQLQVTPRALDLEGVQVGRIGAGVASPDELPAEYRVEVRYGPVASLWEALTKSLDMSLLMVRVMGKMLIGQASVENLSGPITIAETAGRTADYGLGAFVKFLAAVSISLAVLNLLPIPVLDGGHLLYYLIEWIKGSPLSEQAQMQGQRVGIVLLAALMGLAFYVDLSRIFG